MAKKPVKHPVFVPGPKVGKGPRHIARVGSKKK